MAKAARDELAFLSFENIASIDMRIRLADKWMMTRSPLRINSYFDRAPSIEDPMITSIAKRKDFCVVTRNVKDFEYLDIDLVNPFEYRHPS